MDHILTKKMKRCTSTVESVQVIIIIIMMMIMMMVMMVMIMMMMIMIMIIMIMIMIIVSEDMPTNNEWMKQTTRNTK